MPEEAKPKKVKFGIENGKFIISLDLNQDGEPMLSLSLDLKEVPEEVLSLFKK